MVKELKNKFIISLNGMAMGLFSTLIIGLIIKQIALLFGHTEFASLLMICSSVASALMGVGIGIGVASKLTDNQAIIYASAVNGLIGAIAIQLINGGALANGVLSLSGGQDPLAAYFATIFGVVFGSLIKRNNAMSIILTPLVTLLGGTTLILMIAPFISQFNVATSLLIEQLMFLNPFLMGMGISVFMGIFLTLPISSAAIAIILNLSGLAAGAATVGCCAQMLGFAIISYRENGLKGFIAQGLGTSMIQMPNIIRNPLVFLPPIITSAILGPLATTVFGLTNIASGAGMGTSGLVGPIFSIGDMLFHESRLFVVILKVTVLCIILPLFLNYIIGSYFRSKGWIKDGDLKLDL